MFIFNFTILYINLNLHILVFIFSNNLHLYFLSVQFSFLVLFTTKTELNKLTVINLKKHNKNNMKRKINVIIQGGFWYYNLRSTTE